MLLANLNRRELSNELKKHFTPASPIKTIEHLIGREDDIEACETALLSSGRHLFIFGDRGVGKTSLAQTAAFLIHPASTDPIIMACTERLTFFQFIADCLQQMLRQVSKEAISEAEIKLNMGPISAKFKLALDKNINTEIKSINAVVQILKFISLLASGTAIIIVDEFDRMEHKHRELFSHVVKQVSDQDICVKFIFCGVASAMDEFVGFHHSAGRYVYARHLDRLSVDNRKHIISSAYECLEIQIETSMLTRIAQISDGYPYFVHLIGEQIVISLWKSLNELTTSNEPNIFHVSDDQFKAGIENAVTASEAFLKVQYESSIKAGQSSHNEIILWATSDSPTLSQSVSDIYDKSYISLCDQFKVVPLERRKFQTRLAQFRTNTPKILVSKRRGFYQFSENMMRGYVRMRAQCAGAILTPDHHLGVRRRAM